MDTENLTLTLKNPVKLDDGTVFTELTLRELTVDEIILLDRAHGTKGVNEQDKHYYAMSCGVPPEAIGKLKSRDWGRLKQLFWQTVGKLDDDLPSENTE